jgi:hypothetical protein
LTTANTSYGYTKTVGEYNLYCNYDYPAAITATKANTTSLTYDSAKNTITYNADNGNRQYLAYCDGGATTLAVAATAAVALSVTMV